MLTLAAGSGPDPVLVELILLLSSAGLVAAAAMKFRVATVPAYLIAGVIVGPSGLDLLGLLIGEDATGPTTTAVGNLSIVLLLFGIGMHLDASILKSGAARMIGAGVGCVLGCTALLFPALLAGGFSWSVSLTAAMALSLSSTAVVMNVLIRKRELHRVSGRFTLAILIVQDVAVVLMLLALPLLAYVALGDGAVGDDGKGVNVWVTLLGGLAMVLGIIAAGKLALPWLLTRASMASDGAGEVLTVLSVAFALASAGGTSWVGLSPELGAFLAGFVLSSTTFKYQLTGQVGAIRDVFLAVFFVAVGMQVDLGVLVGDWWRVALGVAAVLVVKAVTIGFIVWASGTTRGVAAKVGCSLAQGGEFGLILIGMAAGGLGLISEAELSIFTGVIVITLIATPGLISLGEWLSHNVSSTRLAPWIGSTTLLDADESMGDRDERPLVVVAGFGVVGRAVVDRLCPADIRTCVVETNPATVEKQKALGRPIVFGDISDPEVMHAAGVPEARALVLTIPDDAASVRAVRTAKSLAPDIKVVVRSQYVSRASEVRRHGADETVVEELATAQAMERMVEELLMLEPVDTDPNARLAH
ncbi:MAG: cation:proton antiporter [Phycisphaerales bacterium]